MPYRLILNPGSTSTKVALYEGSYQLFSQTIQHSQDQLEQFKSIVAQKEFRKDEILRFLQDNKITLSEIEGIIAIGGLIRPGDAGVILVTEDMVGDLEQARYNEHAANLGALIAWDLANQIGIRAYVADAITTDEMHQVARLSGIPEIKRTGRSHTLNQKSTSRKAALKLGTTYEKARLVVAHLGGGISVTAHCNGRMIDTNAARGEGPFCIDRTGGVNSFELARLCYSGKYEKNQMLKKINGDGGVVAYLGTRDFRDVLKRMNEGDSLALEVFHAMAYQVAKEIAAQTVPLEGKTDAIVLTGGMAHSKELTDAIEKHVSHLAPVLVFPGESEMEALAEYLDDILSGRREARSYIAEGEEK